MSLKTWPYVLFFSQVESFHLNFDFWSETHFIHVVWTLNINNSTFLLEAKSTRCIVWVHTVFSINSFALIEWQLVLNMPSIWMTSQIHKSLRSITILLFAQDALDAHQKTWFFNIIVKCDCNVNLKCDCNVNPKWLLYVKFKINNLKFQTQFHTQIWGRNYFGK